MREARGSFRDQWSDGRFVDDRADHRGIASGRVHAWDVLPVDQDDASGTALTEVVRGRGAGEAGADDEDIGIEHGCLDQGKGGSVTIDWRGRPAATRLATENPSRP